MPGGGADERRVLYQWLKKFLEKMAFFPEIGALGSEAGEALRDFLPVQNWIT